MNTYVTVMSKLSRSISRSVPRITVRSEWYASSAVTNRDTNGHDAGSMQDMITRGTNSHDAGSMQDMIDQGIIDHYLTSKTAKKYEEELEGAVDSDSTASSTSAAAAPETGNMGNDVELSRMADLIDPELVDSFLSSSQQVYQEEAMAAGIMDTLSTINATSPATAAGPGTPVNNDMNKAMMEILSEVRELSVEVKQLREEVKSLIPRTRKES